jgi:hypothetical protein
MRSGFLYSPPSLVAPTHVLKDALNEIATKFPDTEGMRLQAQIIREEIEWREKTALKKTAANR